MKVTYESESITTQIGRSGRLVIPVSVRQNMNVRDGSVLVLYNQGDGSYLMRASTEEPRCSLCGTPRNLTPLKSATKHAPDQYLCAACLARVKNITP